MVRGASLVLVAALAFLFGRFTNDVHMSGRVLHHTAPSTRGPWLRATLTTRIRLCCLHSARNETRIAGCCPKAFC
jgi:hypothetical protein